MASRPVAVPDLDDDADELAEADSQRLQEVWERALTRFDTLAIPQQELRAQSLEARRFVTIPGAMWEGAWGEQFENSPRPEVDKITKSLEKIETDYRENRLAAEFLPANDLADEDTADTLNGMYRADAYNYKAQQAKDNAFQEAIRGGFGAWRLTTDYADPYDPDSDELRVNPGVTIVDADQSVYFYGGILYDKSDAQGCFVLTRELRQIAIEKWGAENIAQWPMQNYKYAWDWFQMDIVCIAEYYEVEEVPDRRITLNHPLTGEQQRYWASEIEPSAVRDMTGSGWKKSERKSTRRRVHKYILNGDRVLKDCGYIAGDAIPIVPVYYRRDYVDNMERWRGFVGKKMDRQRIYNTSVAKVVETQSIAPYEVPMVDPDQVDENILAQWARGNQDRLPLRFIKALRQPDGSIVSSGPVGVVKPPDVQPATAALLQIASADLTDEDQNADEVKSNVSADAMDIAATRVDAKSGIALDNMRQSIQREAEIYLGMAREVNFEPGRKVDTLSEDNQSGTATLSQPHIDPNSNVFSLRNDLARGRYKVVASVTESTATKRQKMVRQNLALAEIAGNNPSTQDLAAGALLSAVMNMDGEGAQDMQEFARNKLIALGIVKPTPEEQREIAKAQAAQAQQQQQPSPEDQAMGAQVEMLSAKADYYDAQALDKHADVILKVAQAHALGGPDQVPVTPTGLTQVNPLADAVDAKDKLASANLKDAQALNLTHEMQLKRVKTGHEILMERRQQSLAEQQAAQPQNAA